ncbi:hypothetical protein MTO96_046407 [Rhipicephalus appendiculatus]
MIVNQRNPKALEAKRIKNTTTVVVLFDGMKVPNYVMCGVSLLRCTLYKRQNDVCYACGGLGHRADVCPNPNKRVCRGCGLASPSDDHQCSPKCALCGGPHPTADRTCKERFQVPYVVRRRRRRRRKRAKNTQQLAQESRSRDSSVSSTPRRGRSVTPAGRRSSSSRGRSHSRVRIQKEPTWADRAKPKPAAQPREVTQAPLPEHREDPRVAKLIQENACLKAELHQLRADLESFRKSYSSQGETQQTPPPGDAQARSVKRRASPPEAEWDAMETESNSKALESMQQSIKQLADSMTALLKRVSSLESTQAALATGSSPPTGPSRAQSPVGVVTVNPTRDWLSQNSNHGGQH